MNKLKEKTIETKLSRYYRGENFKVKNQFWISQKRIDILAKKRDTNEILAIEVKISDWQTALRQANLNKVICHKSYVAIWHAYSHRVKLDSFAQLGIGLIIINADFIPTVLLDPLAPQILTQWAYDYVLEKL